MFGDGRNWNGKMRKSRWTGLVTHFNVLEWDSGGGNFGGRSPYEMIVSSSLLNTVPSWKYKQDTKQIARMGGKIHHQRRSRRVWFARRKNAVIGGWEEDYEKSKSGIGVPVAFLRYVDEEGIEEEDDDVLVFWCKQDTYLVFEKELWPKWMITINWDAPPDLVEGTGRLWGRRRISALEQSNQALLYNNNNDIILKLMTSLYSELESATLCK